MEEELEIILKAVDDASATLEAIKEQAEQLGNSFQESGEKGKESFEKEEEEAEQTKNTLQQLQDVMEGIAGIEIFKGLADALWDAADKAGTFEDSLMRARLEAEGAGIDVNDMTDAVSELSRTTGRAGGQIRESFIKATARGITDMDSFKKMMEGAGAQATLFGTDIESMADKFSNMAMRSTLMERSLASTGITMEELAEAMGMAGATADEVKSKWQELDTNERAAALGLAASMNEGKTANEEYKKSWAGLQAQLDIAKGRLERLAGEVLLPVLIPAIELAARVLNWLGDVINALINGPLGGLISVIGASAAAFALAVPAYMAVTTAYGFLTGAALTAATALWAALAPVLPFIVAGAALAYVVYEIGKAFGWWSDVSSMMDAIWAGVQRLWSAFINHPDVQGFINDISTAWKLMQPYIKAIIDFVLRFFKVSGKKDFDLVRTLINAIGTAWRAITTPIRTVISLIQAIWRAFQTMYTKAKEAIDNTKKAMTSLTTVNISGLTSKLTKPFTDAYTKIVKTVKDIKSQASSIGSSAFGWLGNFGFDFEGMLEAQSQGGASSSMDINLNVDLANVPAGVDTQTLIAVLTDPQVLSALTGSSDFQSLDARAKNRLALKQARAGGA